LQIIAHGNWRIVPEFLFYKQTKRTTYIQAAWEMQGGFLPVVSSRYYLGHLCYSLKYHVLAVVDISRAINLLPLSILQRVKLYTRTGIILLIHISALAIRYKPRKIHGQ